MRKPTSITISAAACTPSPKSGSRKNARMNQTILQRYIGAAAYRLREIPQFLKVGLCPF